MNSIGKRLKKLADSREPVSSRDGEEEPSEVWISPQHWKAMDEEQKSIIVDLWHNDNSYSSVFPFGNMTAPTESYGAGITFSGGRSENKDNKISGSAAQATIEILKIPHSLLSYKQLEDARKKFMESKTKEA